MLFSIVSKSYQSAVNIYISETAITLNGEPRKAMADQITTVSKKRIDSRIGTISEQDLDSIIQVVKRQLGI